MKKYISAASKQVGPVPEFTKACKKAAADILTVWASDIKCTYDGGPHSRRDFILQASHSWSTAYCDWSDDKQELLNALSKVGATNFIGKVTWNYVDLAFDIKASALKQYRKAESEVAE